MTSLSSATVNNSWLRMVSSREIKVVIVTQQEPTGIFFLCKRVRGSELVVHNHWSLTYDINSN